MRQTDWELAITVSLLIESVHGDRTLGQTEAFALKLTQHGLSERTVPSDSKKEHSPSENVIFNGFEHLQTMLHRIPSTYSSIKFSLVPRNNDAAGRINSNSVKCTLEEISQTRVRQLGASHKIRKLGVQYAVGKQQLKSVSDMQISSTVINMETAV